MEDITVTKNTEVGTFILTDSSYLEQFTAPKGASIISIPEGEYLATVTVTPVDKSQFHEIPVIKKTLKLNTGRLYVGDPNEFFHNQNKWFAFLRATKYMKQVPQGVIVIDTGGDGKGKIQINLKPVSG